MEVFLVRTVDLAGGGKSPGFRFLRGSDGFRWYAGQYFRLILTGTGGIQRYWCGEKKKKTDLSCIFHTTSLASVVSKEHTNLAYIYQYFLLVLAPELVEYNVTAEEKKFKPIFREVYTRFHWVSVVSKEHESLAYIYQYFRLTVFPGL